MNTNQILLLIAGIGLVIGGFVGNDIKEVTIRESKALLVLGFGLVLLSLI